MKMIFLVVSWHRQGCRGLDSTGDWQRPDHDETTWTFPVDWSM
jgi:hypothetical protein